MFPSYIDVSLILSLPRFLSPKSINIYSGEDSKNNNKIKQDSVYENLVATQLSGTCGPLNHAGIYVCRAEA